MSSHTVKVDIDTKTFVRFWLVILGLGLLALFLWKALTGLIIVGIAIFLAIAIKPLAEKLDTLDKKKKRPTLTAVGAFLIVVLGLGLIVAVIGPTVVSETAKFVGQLPETFENTLGGWNGINDFGKNLGIENLQGEITTAVENFSTSFLSNIGTMLASGLGAISGMVTSVILTLVLTLLFLLQGPALLKELWNVLEGKRPDASVQEARRVVSRMARVISTYVSKQATVAILDGVVVALAVFILSLIFGFSAGLAFPMGLLSFVFYLIPMFGQVIACAIITLILFFGSPAAGLIYLVFYIVYSQIENNAIAPKIQGDALNLPPVIILVAITIGMYMFGLIGAIVAIPIAGCLKVLLEEYPTIKELNEKSI